MFPRTTIVPWPRNRWTRACVLETPCAPQLSFDSWLANRLLSRDLPHAQGSTGGPLEQYREYVTVSQKFLGLFTTGDVLRIPSEMTGGRYLALAPTFARGEGYPRLELDLYRTEHLLWRSRRSYTCELVVVRLVPTVDRDYGVHERRPKDTLVDRSYGMWSLASLPDGTPADITLSALEGAGLQRLVLQLS